MSTAICLPTRIADFLFGLCTTLVSQGGSFVIYKLPHIGVTRVYCSKQSGFHRMSCPQINRLKQGFLLHSFAPARSYEVLKPQAIFTLHPKASHYEMTQESVRGHYQWAQSLWKEGMHRSRKNGKEEYLYPAPKEKERDGGQAKYTQKVEKALQTIKKGALKKVVLCRRKYLHFPQGDIFDAYVRLCELHRSSFVYLLSGEDIGTWIGATPELLLEKTPQIWRTQALSGTQAMPDSGNVYDISWGEKEKQEHAWTVEYIRSVLSQEGLADVRVRDLGGSRSGNIAHLCVYFEGRGDVGMAGGWRLLHRLHPTPAVGGMPKELALPYIEAEEGFNRQYYTGFLGPMEGEKMSLYVNIRCASMHREQICLYAGAGIVSGSDPYDEWLETESKCHALSQILHTYAYR